MQKSILLVSLVGFICGCAMTKPVTPVGGNIYTVSAFHKEDALKAADKYCSNQGKKILVTQTHEENNTSWASLVFKCLSPDDPELRQPQNPKEPSTIMNDRQR
jgi:hypothetical protein